VPAAHHAADAMARSLHSESTAPSLAQQLIPGCDSCDRGRSSAATAGDEKAISKPLEIDSPLKLASRLSLRRNCRLSGSRLVGCLLENIPCHRQILSRRAPASHILTAGVLRRSPPDTSARGPVAERHGDILVVVAGIDPPLGTPSAHGGLRKFIRLIHLSTRARPASAAMPKSDDDSRRTGSRATSKSSASSAASLDQVPPHDTAVAKFSRCHALDNRRRS
jgi:hypothetical protein